MRRALVACVALAFFAGCSGDDAEPEDGAPVLPMVPPERGTPPGADAGWYTPRPLGKSDANVPVASLAAGGNFTCARIVDGTVRCWGDDSASQLAGSSRLAPIAGLSDVVEVSAGMLHACARTKDGRVACWGSNSHGQLGDLSGPPKSDVPLFVRGIAAAKSIVSSVQSTCAMHDDGTITCWGRMHVFFPGVPPTKLDTGGKRARTVRPTTGGPMIVFEDGSAQVRGAGGNGPVITFANRKIMDVAQGVTGQGLGFVARLDDGSLRVWAAAPVYSRCIDPATLSTLVPTPSRDVCDARAMEPLFVCGLPIPQHVCPAGGKDCETIRDIAWFPKGDAFADVRMISMNEGWIGTGAENLGGLGFGCALSAGGRVRCFGADGSGQVGTGKAGLAGNGECTEPLAHEPAFLGSDIVQVVTGGAHACALDRAGAVKCWGQNDLGSTSPTLGSWSQKTGEAPRGPVVFR